VVTAEALLLCGRPRGTAVRELPLDLGGELLRGGELLTEPLERGEGLRRVTVEDLLRGVAERLGV